MSKFFQTTIKPRFSETDMRGHISNTVVPVWLSEGRGSLCREHLGITQPWMVVNLNVNYHRELMWGAEVTVNTAVERIGNSSIRFAQEIWQEGTCCVKSTTTIAALEMETRRPIPVSLEDRKRLEPYIVEVE